MFSLLREARSQVPREHGAWGMLLVPFLIGSLVAENWTAKLLILLGCLLFLFAARYSLFLLARSPSRRLSPGARLWLLFTTAHGLFLAGLLVLRYQLPLLIPLGGAGLLFLLAHLYLARQHRERTVLGELVGISALALSAPASYYASSGVMDQRAAMLWLLNALFFGGSVFYVKARVRLAARKGNPPQQGRTHLTPSDFVYQVVAVTGVLLLSIMGVAPKIVPLAFAPVTIQSLMGLVSTPNRVNFKRLGYTQVGHSIIFATLLVLAFRL